MEDKNTTPELIAGIPAEKAREVMADRKAIREANLAPFPGALRDAFKVWPDIQVDKFKVRPFYDGDIDVLEQLEHPLAHLINGSSKAMEGIDKMRGQGAWNLCYLMTHRAEEIGKMLEEKSLDEFRREAKKEFSFYAIGALVAIQSAAIQQFNIYFSTMIGLEPDDGEDKKKV